MRLAALLLSAALLLPGCAGAQGLALPETVAIPAGPFIEGSDAAEREAAYRLDEAAYGHSVTRKQGWYDHAPPRREATTAAYAITVTPITNRQYLAFVEATGHPAPDVEPRVWRGYGLIHPYERTRRHAWIGGRPPEGRLDHPVVLVSQGDARAYADWLSAESGRRWRLPTGREWEKAARGPGGGLFSWGDAWDAGKLNSHDSGPFDTLPVGSFPAGASPYGLLDAAGQVYEWTSDGAGEGRYLVRGGSWDDSGCGVCRPAARHGRPEDIKHILIGFRLVREEG